MNANSSSTDRVREFRQRQRDASRKLVRFYLDAESAAMLEQLASGRPHAALAEALLTTAIAQAWSAREAQKHCDRKEREGRSHAGHQPAATAETAKSAHFLGRRRSFAASNDSLGEAPGL